MNGRTRVFLGIVGLVGLLALAGCLSPVSDADLAENATYDWESDANASYRLYAGNYTAVIDIQDRESLELSLPDGLGSRQPIPISALQFRYPNGTVIDGAGIERRNGSISRNRDRVLVTLPADAPPGGGGKLAFTADSTPKRFTLPVFVEGSYEVVLPPDRRVEVPVFGSVSPGGYATERIDGQTHIAWDEVTGRSVIVQFYLQRDLYIFGGIAAALVVIGLAGLAYYRRKIEALRKQREELGLDVEKDDDDDEFRRGPPPGMR